MNASTKVLGFAAGFFGLAVAFGIYVAAEERAARSSLEDIAKAEARLRLQLHRAEARARDQETQRDKLSKSIAVSDPAPRARRSDQARGGIAGQAEMVARLRALLADPRYRELRKQSITADLKSRYAPLVAKLGLPPAEAERLGSLAADHQLQSMDLWTAAAQNGDQASNQTAGAQMKVLNDQLQAEISAALGPEGYRQYTDFNRTQEARDLSGQLAAQIFYTGTPLTADQGAALTVLISSASTSYQQGGRVNLYAVNWDAVMATAQGVLTPAQLAALQSLREQRAADTAMAQVRAQLRDAKASSP